jgi:anthranilate synthase component 2
MLLMIDNYDSFTFNLVQYFGELGDRSAGVPQRRNHGAGHCRVEARPAGAVARGLAHRPKPGICVEAIRHFTGKLPLLGVCLGHQAIGAALGGKVVRAQVQMHGKASTLSTDGRGVYKGLPSQFSVIRYHSLAIEKATLPDCLEVTSTSEDGEIMGVRHRELAGTATPLEGVQFHPESILSEHGHAMLRNFIEMSASR